MFVLVKELGIRIFNLSNTSLICLFPFEIALISLPSLLIALAFRSWIGGEHAINTYCHTLAFEGGKRLAEVMGTSLMDTTETSELTLSMVNVALPLSDDIPFNNETNVYFQKKLLLEWNCFAAHYKHDGKWWTRCSAQIWNEVGVPSCFYFPWLLYGCRFMCTDETVDGAEQISDFEYLGKAYLAACKELEAKYEKDELKEKE